MRSNLSPTVKVVKNGRELETNGRPVSLAMGFFDGVHLGHQAVLQRAVETAVSSKAVPVAVTFDRHPATVVAPQRAPALIYPLEKRLQVLSERGMAADLLLPFDTELSRLAPADFVAFLLGQFASVVSIAVGRAFLFGHKRSGNFEVLAELGRSRGFQAQGVEPVHYRGDVVSSTRVRDAIRRGRFDVAGDLLGRPYGLVGSVVDGQKRGRQLGFPTANLGVAGVVLPPCGVYAAKALVDSRTVSRNAVVNIGHRPTLDGGGNVVHVEAHLLDFGGDLYGEIMELVFLAKLREELKFPDLAALKRQINDDIASARRFF